MSIKITLLSMGRCFGKHERVVGYIGNLTTSDKKSGVLSSSQLSLATYCSLSEQGARESGFCTKFSHVFVHGLGSNFPRYLAQRSAFASTVAHRISARLDVAFLKIWRLLVPRISLLALQNSHSNTKPIQGLYDSHNFTFNSTSYPFSSAHLSETLSTSYCTVPSAPVTGLVRSWLRAPALPILFRVCCN